MSIRPRRPSAVTDPGAYAHPGQYSHLSSASSESAALVARRLSPSFPSRPGCGVGRGRGRGAEGRRRRRMQGEWPRRGRWSTATGDVNAMACWTWRQSLVNGDYVGIGLSTVLDPGPGYILRTGINIGIRVTLPLVKGETWLSNGGRSQWGESVCQREQQRKRTLRKRGSLAILSYRCGR